MFRQRIGQRHALIRGAGMRDTVEGGSFVRHAETVWSHEALSDDGIAIARHVHCPAELHDARLVDVARIADVVTAILSDRALLLDSPARPIVGFYIDAD